MKRLVPCAVLACCLFACAAAAAVRPGGPLPALEGFWRAEAMRDYRVLTVEIDAAAGTAVFSEGGRSKNCTFAVQAEQGNSVTLFLKEPKTAITFELLDDTTLLMKQNQKERLLTRHREAIRSRATPAPTLPARPSFGPATRTNTAP